jgi:hypothetical protein
MKKCEGAIGSALSGDSGQPLVLMLFGDDPLARRDTARTRGRQSSVTQVVEGLQ